MRRQTLEDVPEDHRRFRGAIEGEVGDGIRFRLEVRVGRRRLGSSGLVRAQIKSMTRGRPLLPSDMYEDVTDIVLFVDGRRRFDIDVAPSGFYKHGRRTERSLRKLVGGILEDFSPSPLSSSGP